MAVGVPVPKQEQNARDQDEDPDEPARPQSTGGEDSGDAELWDAEKPPADEGRPRRRVCGYSISSRAGYSGNSARVKGGY